MERPEFRDTRQVTAATRVSEQRFLRFRVLLCVVTLLAVNLCIAAKLFTIEYSAHTGSIESTFIAISRVMAKYPGEWNWWPLWNGGLPFENAYLPLAQFLVSTFSLLTGFSAARSFHIVMGAAYVAGALTLFWMALVLSRKLIASFVAALAYSCWSVTPLLSPAVALDTGGVLNLRRLYVLVFWGESPHTVALALLPVSIVCLHRALTTGSMKWKVLTGVFAASVALSNAFGAAALAITVVAWLLAYRSVPWWKAPLTVAAIGVLSYCWVSPWLSPAMIRALRENSMTAGGDYRYTSASWAALLILLAGYALLSVVLNRLKPPAHLRFFALFAYVPTAVAMTWQLTNIPVLPQPNRYHLEVELALIPLIVFSAAVLLERLPRAAHIATVLVATTALGWQTTHAARSARELIRPVDPHSLSEYKIATWMDWSRPGHRVFAAGSTALMFNAFTDHPQLQGGHNQHTVNPFIPIVDFTIRTGMNAGERDTEYSIFWMKAFGVRAIAVTGPNSTDYYKPYVNPGKFDGVLPLLWREGDDAIYEVPLRSASLAHVVPASAVPARRPLHGLDIAPVQAYVDALDDPRFPLASFEWRGMSEAAVHTTLSTGQVVSVQITYEKGWEAFVNGERRSVRGDAIGQMVVEPGCDGPCEITLRYAGGAERTVTRGMSLAAMFVAAALLWNDRRRRGSFAPAAH